MKRFDCCPVWGMEETPEGEFVRYADIVPRYFELLYAVANKYPGESRHETALRYIIQRETGSGESCKANREAPRV